MKPPSEKMYNLARTVVYVQFTVVVGAGGEAEEEDRRGVSIVDACVGITLGQLTSLAF